MGILLKESDSDIMKTIGSSGGFQNETDIQNRKQAHSFAGDGADSCQPVMWNAVEQSAEKCYGMVGKYLPGILFFGVKL